MPVYNIPLSVPAALVLASAPVKTRHMAHIIPGDVSTYIYTERDAYYRGYQDSVFGKTCRKGGYDCMRHYEILMNGCIPWFEDLPSFPPTLMQNFPTKIVLDAMKSETPEEYIPELLEYTRTHLTTRASAQYLLDTVGIQPKRVLFLGSDPAPDCTRDLLLSGLKEILGKNCCESVYVPHIYDDYGSMASYYGRGFTYSKSVPAALKPPPIHISEIENHAFDMVLYGSYTRGAPYWDLVNSVYSKNEIVIVCGEDTHDLEGCEVYRLGKLGYNVFIRELIQP